MTTTRLTVSTPIGRRFRQRLRQHLRERLRRDERGQAAGAETVAFGVLVLLGATMLAANVWAAIDARSTLDNAARDYLRAYTAAPNRATAELDGRDAALRSIGDRWPDLTKKIAAPPEPFGPCRVATVAISMQRSAVHIPFIGDVGSHTITATQSELVQPYGDAIDEVANLPASACDE